jgi:hypothetical protein
MILADRPVTVTEFSADSARHLGELPTHVVGANVKVGA